MRANKLAASLTTAHAAEADTRLSGRWLLVIRLGWLLCFTVSIVQFVLVLPYYRAEYLHPAADNAVLSPGAIAALTHARFALDTYAWVSLAIACLAVLISAAAALVLFWRRGDDWMALLVSLFIIVYVSSSAGIANPGPSSGPGFTLDAPLYGLESGLMFALVFGVFYLFPSGRFVPRWSWALLIISTTWSIAILARPNLLGGILYLGYPIFIGAAIASQIYRYRRASTPVQQLQTKWVVAGIILTVLANQVFWLPSGITPLGQTLYAPLAYLVYQLTFLLVPVTFFVAIQRFRLYNIDTIINRALVYVSLTVILGATYAACVIGAQSLIQALTGQTGLPPVLIVASTLLIVVLFTPLRTRIQRTIDRRFYRHKYDAAKTLERFAATLRNEVELGALSDDLCAVVDETMRPARVSLWLQAPQAGGASSPASRQ